MRKEERSGKRRGAALCCLCFFLAALCLGLCASLAYARYVSSGAYDAPVGVDGLHVTSTITYTDAGGGAKAIGYSLGAMKSGSSGISMTLTVKNESAFAVSCHVTIGDGFIFASCDSGVATISADGVALTLTGAIAAGDTVGATFVVKADSSSGVVFKHIELTVNYEQAG